MANQDTRILIIRICIFLVGIIFIIELFNLQIIHGEEYREQAQNRTQRTAKVNAPRGEILDRYGEILATNREGFNLMLYRTEMTVKERNEMLSKLIKIMEKWQTTYRDTFPIEVEPCRFTFESENSEKSFKKQNSFKEEDTAEKVFNYYAKRYEVDTKYSLAEKRDIVAMRYELEKSGYSSYTAYEVAVDVGKELISEVTERSEEFPGLSVEVQPIREYPEGSLASHVLGYIGKISDTKYEELKSEGYNLNDNIGKDGIESVMESYLKGKNASESIYVDEYGRYILNSNNKVEAGAQVYLTIDAKLQKVAENALEENIKKIASGYYSDGSSEAKSGAVIAIDVKTGEILAMASYPDYDPNVFVKGISSEKWRELNNETKPMFNRNIMGLYSPGSIYKMIVAVAALETGAITTATTVNDEGVYKKYKTPQPKCWIWTSAGRTHGVINVSEAISYSCNYFFYTVGEMVGIEKIEEYAKLFGLGAKTNIELIGEKEGIIAGKTYANEQNRKWLPGETLSASIGQSSNSFTPIQIARYIAILANGGMRVEPHLIKSVIKSNGGEISVDELNKYLNDKLDISGEEALPDKIELKKTTLDAVYKGMESVTGDSGGTAYNMFKDFPIKVAGKTGSVQVSGNKADNAWFLGFAPYDNPEIAICAVIEQGAHGNYTAAIIKEILEEYFALKEENQNTKVDAVIYNNELIN